MQRVLIAEDDAVQAKMIEDTLHKYDPCWVLVTAHDYEEGMALLTRSVSEQNYFSLFLLDIQLTASGGDRGGFVLASEIRRQKPYFQTPILFLTSLQGEQPAALSHFHCYDYITKPYTAEALLFQLQQLQLTGFLSRTMEIMDTARVYHCVNMDDIVMVETLSHGLSIHTTGDVFHTRQYTLVQMKQLLGDAFLQCHRRYLVRKKRIQTVDVTTQLIRLSDGTSLPIGRTYLAQVRELIRVPAPGEKDES